MKAPGPDTDDLAVQFTIRQMTIAIAVIGVVLALAVRVPFVLVAGGDALLIGFGVYKLSRMVFAKHAPEDEPPWPPIWFRIAVATVLVLLVLGFLIPLFFPVTSE